MNDLCPREEELARLLAGLMSAADEAKLEAHVAGCALCQDRLDQLTQGKLALPTASARGLPAGRPSNILERVAQATPTPVPEPPRVPERAEGTPSPFPVIERTRSGPATVLSATGQFIRRREWTWPLLAAALLGGAGWWVHWSVESAMRQQRVNELTTILDADVAALQIWIDNQRTLADQIAAAEPLRSLAEELIAEAKIPAPPPLDEPRKAAQSALRGRLSPPLRRGGYAGFMLVSPAGQVLASDQDAPVGHALTGYLLEVMQKVALGHPMVSRPFRSPLPLVDEQGKVRVDQPSMFAAAPLRDAQGKPIAVLALRIRPEEQFTGILRVARSGESGETYAFDRHGLLLSQSRFDDALKQSGLLLDQPDSHSILTIEVRDPGVNLVEKERPALRRADQPLTRMAATAVQGQAGCDADGYRDYRGVPVVGAWRWLNDYDFGVATEIDVAEAFRPLHQLRRAFGMLMGLLALSALGTFVATWLIARQQRAWQEAALAARRLGPYTLLEKIGAGGMGTVYKARHALLRRPTAVKVLNAGIMSPQAVARFEREVQVTSGLTHPHTVMIYDYGHTPEGVCYFAMEYLDGMNLSELVSRHGPLSEARLVYILRQVCEALAEAHAAGLVHRDIKPANIVLTCRGGLHDFVKVVDFGLVRVLDRRDGANVTSPEFLAGTPHYLAPEAANQPDQVDVRMDVYALGALGYFLLTGTPVFQGTSVLEICLKHATEPPEPPVRRLGRPVSPELEALLLGCLAKARENRPADAGDLLRRLEAITVAGSWSAANAAAWWALHHAAQASSQADGQQVGPSAKAGIR